MRNSPRKPYQIKSSGFTLLELLVVIAIIGILAGLMFPATTGVMRKAERTRASNTAYNLKTAISSYFTEYRKYPVEPDREETQELRSNHELMDVLLGSDIAAQSGGLNPRRIAFYTGKQAKRGEDDTYKSGIHLKDQGAGELWDPWFDYYYVRLDLDYNNRVQRPEWDNSTESDELPESILIWSAGKDNLQDTRSDNVITW
ncbi:MAG: type II secretion system protein [Verrucomicrobiota bacterium]